MEKIKISFLLDKNNNWVESYLLKIDFLRLYPHFDIKISHNHLEVKNQVIVFILGYTKILSDDFLIKNDLNLVIHESNLPQGKGFSPVQWQILEGKNIIPICLFEATNQVDAGDILYRHKLMLTGYELYDEIRKIQAKASIEIILKFLDIYPDFTKEKQIGEQSFYRRRNKNDSELDAGKSIKDQFNLLRIGNNEEWPSFFYLEGRKYFIKTVN